MARPQPEHDRARARPNVIFIMADDQAAWTLSAAGHANARTPELDRLAQGGALVRNGFAVAAVCSPSRASVLTSRYGTEVGINDVLGPGATGIEPLFLTWPQVLRDAGYQTAFIGKWHVGDADERYLPTGKGYEWFAGYPVGGTTSRDPTLLIDGRWMTFHGQFTSDVLADLAICRVEEFKESPFLISLHFWAPHANQGVPDDVQVPYNDRTWLPLKPEDVEPWEHCDVTLPDAGEGVNLDVSRVTRMMREYHASVHSNDRNVGRIMRRLDELELTENTIVIYTSDHGYMLGHHGLWHKGNGWWMTTDRRDPSRVYTDLMRDRPLLVRHNLFDESIRVPVIIRWPMGVPAGVETTETFTHLDWFPTLLAMTGLPRPTDATLRGRDYLPILQGHRDDEHDELFAQHEALRAVRTPQWKLIRDLSRLGRDELYHLRVDPQEYTNLIACDDAEVAAVRSELNGRLIDQMKLIDDPLLPVASGVPVGSNGASL